MCHMKVLSSQKTDTQLQDRIFQVIPGKQTMSPVQWTHTGIELDWACQLKPFHSPGHFNTFLKNSFSNNDSVIHSLKQFAKFSVYQLDHILDCYAQNNAHFSGSLAPTPKTVFRHNLLCIKMCVKCYTLKRLVSACRVHF